MLGDRAWLGEFWVIDTVGMGHSLPLILLACQNMEESKTYGLHVETIVLGLIKGSIYIRRYFWVCIVWTGITCFVALKASFETTTTFWIRIKINSFILSYISDNDIHERVKRKERISRFDNKWSSNMTLHDMVRTVLVVLVETLPQVLNTE